MNVIMISPGYPSEMPFYTRGLAAHGARVLGVSDQPFEDLPELARRHLAAYFRVVSLWDEDDVLESIGRWTTGTRIDRVECLWEPGVLLAACLRDVLGVAGHSHQQVLPFRDKDLMKQIVSAAGVRTPRHARPRSANECHEAADRIGYPVIIKPIAGAGSQDTYRVDGPDELDRVLPSLAHLQEVNLEEFIDGEEYTYDTICIDGRIAFEHIAWYRPRPLIARHMEWITPQIVSLRNLDAPELAGGRAMGRAVLDALGHGTGFTHMEWFRKSDGDVVFGEIAARPAGARSVDAMNYACDIDLFDGWAEAVVHGSFSQPVERRYNAALMFKRAQGDGHIRRIDGLDSVLARFGEHIACLELAPLGSPRRDWRQSLTAEGWLVVRHPLLQELLDMADTIGVDLQLRAW